MSYDKKEYCSKQSHYVDSYCDDPRKYCRTNIIKLFERDLNSNFIFFGKMQMSRMHFFQK